MVPSFAAVTSKPFRRSSEHKPGRLKKSVELRVSMTKDVKNLRGSISWDLINTRGHPGGTPPSPSSCAWLMPSGPNVGKKIVTSVPDEGEVSFFDEMNGTNNWTDPYLSNTMWVRRVHMNELRWGIKTLSRGLWVTPIYWAAGLFSILPDTPWITEAIGHLGPNPEYPNQDYPNAELLP